MSDIYLFLNSCSFQVNAGPLAYARAFLDDTNTKRYPDNKVKLLKEVFRYGMEGFGFLGDGGEGKKMDLFPKPCKNSF